MIKYIKSKQMVEKEIVEFEECICDGCKKCIYKCDKRIKQKIGNTKRIHYWYVSTNSDIQDSYESYEVCSKECLSSIMLDYMKESEEYPEFRPKMEIELVYKAITIEENNEGKNNDEKLIS